MTKIVVDGISEEMFEQYEQVRQSGAVNMFDAETISDLTDLSKMEIRRIQNNYKQLCAAFPKVKNTKYENRIGLVNFNRL